MKPRFQRLEVFGRQFSYAWNRLAVLVLMALPSGCTTTRETAARPYVVQATGKEFAWYFRYPGPDGKIGTGDDVCDRELLHVPANTRIELSLRSADYVYVFSIAGLKLKEMAAPGLEFVLAFDSGAEAVYFFRGDEMCGLKHPPMTGQMLVESSEEVAIQLKGMKRCDD